MKMLQFPSRYRPGESPYDIHKNKMSAILSIVGGIKSIILGKYTKGIMDTVIGGLGKKLTKGQVSEEINLLTTDPTDIYPDEEKLKGFAGQFVDYANVMGKMAQKETMMGRLPAPGTRTSVPSGVIPTGTLPGVAPTPSEEVMLPKGDKMQFLDAFQKMGGQMDFAPVLNYMKENRPFFMGSFSPEEQWVMNQVMGQPTQREKFMQDIKDASLLEQYLATPEEEKANSEVALFQKSPEEYAEYMKLKNSLIGEKKTAWETEAETLFKWYEEDVITLDEFKKGMGIYITPEKKSEFDKKFELASKMGLSINEWKKFFGVWLGDEEISKVKYYKTAAECVAKADKVEGMVVDPTFSAKGYYPNYVKESKDDPNNYLFGKKDVYGNISRMGIIPYDAQMQLSYGQPLSEEQITQIRNNHNLQKSLLDEKMLIKVEAILKQIGINFDEAPVEVTPEPEPESDPVKFWENFSKIFKQSYDYIVPKPTQTQEKDYSAMTEEELKTAVLNSDQKAIEEAKKRGFLK